MRTVLHFVLLIVIAAPIAKAAEPEYVLDSNTAFYEGESLSYVVPPPPDFRLVVTEAAHDGYSFAFIPDADDYDSATMLISVTIYRLTYHSFEQVLSVDTSLLREHYGSSMEVHPVDSVALFNGEETRTLYVNDKSRFLPTVMISYFDGGGEMLIFELTITESGLPRFLAETVYTNCLARVKVLKRGSLGGK